MPAGYKVGQAFRRAKGCLDLYDSCLPLQAGEMARAEDRRPSVQASNSVDRPCDTFPHTTLSIENDRAGVARQRRVRMRVRAHKRHAQAKPPMLSQPPHTAVSIIPVP